MRWVASYGCRHTNETGTDLPQGWKCLLRSASWHGGLTRASDPLCVKVV